MSYEGLTNKQKDALDKIRKAEWGYQTRVPIHLLLDIANQSTIDIIVARTAIKMELDQLIKGSTKNTEVINARVGRERLALVFEEVLNRLEDLNAIYTTELPTNVSDVTFILVKDGV